MYRIFVILGVLGRNGTLLRCADKECWFYVGLLYLHYKRLVCIYLPFINGKRHIAFMVHLITERTKGKNHIQIGMLTLWFLCVSFSFL